MSPRDDRDIVIEELADDAAAANEYIADLEARLRIYRELAHAAGHALYDLRRERDRVRATNHHLLDENRHLLVRSRQRERDVA